MQDILKTRSLHLYDNYKGEVFASPFCPLSEVCFIFIKLGIYIIDII